MNHIEIDPDFVVHKKFYGAAEFLKPTLFWDGAKYCCLLGANADEGLLTAAGTPTLALKLWNNAVLTRLQVPDENDFIYNYVRELIQKASSAERIHALEEVGIVQRFHRSA